MWCRAKVISHWVICFGLEDGTLDLVPHETRAACRDTLAGCDLASICANLGLPGSGPRLFHFSPLSTLSANRAGTRRCAPRRDQEQPSGWNGLRLAEVRRSLPLPPHGYTFQPDFHRDFFPAFNQTTPKLKLPRLWGRLYYPHQPGLASGGLGHFIHTLTLALAHWLGGGFAPPTKQPSKAYHRRDNNSQAHQGCHLLATA